MVLVSVLMGSYNHEPYLSEAIDSVLNQSFRDLELIIIDDCSTDRSKEIIENYQRKDERVRALFHSKNQGIAKTHNELLAEAKGYYISFLDSDDIWVESKLEKQLKILNEDNSLIVWSEGEIISAKGVSLKKTFSQLCKCTNRKNSGYIFEYLLMGNFIFGQSVILQRKYVNGIKFDEQLRYINDWKFMVDLAKKYRFFFINESLAKYRIHGKNSLLSNRESWIKDEVILRKYFLSEYGDLLTNRIKTNILFEMGRDYSYLGEKTTAKFFFLKVLKMHAFSQNYLLNLIYFLTNGTGTIGKFLVSLFQTVDYSLMVLSKRLG
jgi:glycosyltransferase involved in cell wall biosynthesis